MEEVTDILKNPIVRAGLAIAAPEVALGAELVIGAIDVLFSSSEQSAKDLLVVIDKQLASLLEELSTNPSRVRRQELEIRAHELLRLLNNWSKVA